MKSVARSVFVITFVLTAMIAAPALSAENGNLKIQVVEQNYKFDSYSSANGTLQPAQNIKIQVQFAKPSNLAELEKAKEWLRTAEDKYRIANENRYTVNVGSQNISLTAPELIPNGEREEIQIPLSRFQKISNWLSRLTGIVKKDDDLQADISTPAQRSKIKQAFDNFAYKFSTDQLRIPLTNGKSFKLNYLPTLGIARASVNGTVISLSFVASDIPMVAAWATGLTLGAISGAIQYKIKPFSDFLEKKGWIHSWHKKALARYIYLDSLYTSYRGGMSFSLAKEMAASAEEDFMKLKFTDSALYNANLITKWWAVEVAILGLADIMFRAFGAPLETSVMSSVASVLYTSTLATLGQGTWDFAFITDKAKKEEALNERREALIAADELSTEASEEIDRSFAKVKFSLAIKAFTISVSSNIVAALLLADSPSMATVANTAIGTLSVAGAGYYGYMQLKYNEALRAKISKVKSKIAESKVVQTCSGLLEKAKVEYSTFIPGLN